MHAPPIERIAGALSDLVSVEAGIEQVATELITEVEGHPEARALVEETRKLAAAHLQALCERLQGMVSEPPQARASIIRERSSFVEQHPASNALRTVYVSVQDALIRYSLLSPITHRARDSWVVEPEGTSAHICRQHMQEYMRVAGQVMEMVHDVVLWELERDGFECRCTCPCCSIGICVCGVSSRLILGKALAAARPTAGEQGLELRAPRPGSAAAIAGFLRGDVIVGIDGKRLEDYQTLQMAVRDRTLGDQLDFIVRRPAGETIVRVTHRREGVSIRQNECIVPEGQDFYLYQAREAGRGVGSRNGRSPKSDGPLGFLSPRQVQVLRHIALGHTNVEIAEKLEIRRATVSRHVEAILSKTGTANRTEAAALAMREGLAVI